MACFCLAGSVAKAQEGQKVLHNACVEVRGMAVIIHNSGHVERITKHTSFHVGDRIQAAEDARVAIRFWDMGEGFRGRRSGTTVHLTGITEVKILASGVGAKGRTLRLFVNRGTVSVEFPVGVSRTFAPETHLLELVTKDLRARTAHSNLVLSAGKEGTVVRPLAKGVEVWDPRKKSTAVYALKKEQLFLSPRVLPKG
jgi:hypothetical protein